MELNLQPPPFLRGPQVGWRVSTLSSLGLSGDQPHPKARGSTLNYLMSIKAGVILRGLL